MPCYLTDAEQQRLVDPSSASRCRHCKRWHVPMDTIFPFCSTSCKRDHEATSLFLCHDCGRYTAPHGTHHCGCHS